MSRLFHPRGTVLDQIEGRAAAGDILDNLENEEMASLPVP